MIYLSRPLKRIPRGAVRPRRALVQLSLRSAFLAAPARFCPCISRPTSANRGVQRLQMAEGARASPAENIGYDTIVPLFLKDG